MNQSNSPASFYNQPLHSNNPPSILQPHSVSSLQQPHSVSSIQQPHSVSSLQQPHSVSNIQQPHSVNSLPSAQPQSVQPASGPSHVLSVDFSQASTTALNQFELNSLVSSFQYDFAQDEIPEPVARSKELFKELHKSVQSLTGQLMFLVNPANEK